MFQFILEVAVLCVFANLSLPYINDFLEEIRGIRYLLKEVLVHYKEKNPVKIPNSSDKHHVSTKKGFF